jgi:hydroxymethylbilane synthase
VASCLKGLAEVASVELVPMSTRGDEVLDRSLQKIGGKGLFIKELEVAMQDGAAEIAVHSMKDVPAEMPEGFCIAAVLKRANPHDALVTPDGRGLADLRLKARVGSSSLRRQAQLKALRPDIDVIALRGNVNTRLRKLDSGDYDGIVLACAGLERLGFAARISEQFAPAQMLPAAAQGVVGIECRHDRTELRALLSSLEHPETKQTTLAERTVSRRLEASCQSPVASFATIATDSMTLRALVAAEDGSDIIHAHGEGAVDQAEEIGNTVAQKLLDGGAAEFLKVDAT